MSDYKRNRGKPAGTGLSRYTRPTGQNVQPAVRHGAGRCRTRWQGMDEVRIPAWAGVGVIALTVLIVVLVAVGLLKTPAKDSQKDVPVSAQSPIAAATDTLPEVTDALPEATDALPVQEEQPTAEPEIGAEETASQGEAAATSVQTLNTGALRSATIRMAGDVIIDDEMLDASYDKASKSYNFEPYFELIGDTLSSADYTMINIEASLRKGKYGYSGYPQFTTPPILLKVVQKYGVDMITMCNNHMLDGYCDGLVESVGYVEKAGLDHIGGYVDEADSNEPEIYEINGIKVGFVTYTQSTNSLEKHCDDRTKYLVNYFKTSNCYEDISKARQAGAEVIVAVTHWGDEYKRTPESSTRKYAQTLVAAGADVIIGGHPHMVQPAEYITVQGANGQTRTALCLYSLGNFLSQHRVQYTDSGVVFEFTIQEKADGTFEITNPGYVPVYVWTFKNANGDDDYRVLPVGEYLDNPPSGMSADQIQRMKESLQETLELMGGNSVITALKK